SELSDFGSVIWRVSGPEDCVKPGALMERTSAVMNVVRREFIVPSVEESDKLRPSKQQAELYTRKAWRLHKRGIATGLPPCLVLVVLGRSSPRPTGDANGRAKRVCGRSRTRSRRES